MKKMESVRIRDVYKLTPDRKEKPKGKTMTIPGQAQTVAEMVRRMTAGTLTEFSVRRQTVDFDPEEDYDFPDMSKVGNVDLTDRQEVIDNNLIKIDSINKEIEEKKEAFKGSRKGVKPEGMSDMTKEENEGPEGNKPNPKA